MSEISETFIGSDDLQQVTCSVLGCSRVGGSGRSEMF
jgi:hypothetical protein